MTGFHFGGSGSIAKAVERQMRNWELARAQRLEVPLPKRAEVEDFIAVSRQVGASGAEVAAGLAERLDWPVFDKEILDAMAGDDNLRRQVYDSMDERDMGWFEEAARSFMHSEFVKNDYFHQLSKTVLALARQGSAIFIGRGADLILPRDVGLRVRIVAPLETRVKRVAERQDLTEEEAHEKVQRLQEERTQYIRQYFHVNIHDPERYDLTINLQRISPIQAVHLIESSRGILAMNQLAPQQA